MTPRPLTIAIDGNEANVTERVGSNVYAFEIISHLEKLTRTTPDITWVVLLNTAPIADLPAPRSNWSYRLVKPRPFWTQWALPLHLYAHQEEYDLLYTPGHYAPRFSAVPYVSSVMDLAFLEYPEQFKRSDLVQLRSWTQYSVAHARAVITISEYSKRAIQKAYGLSSEKIVVAPPAVSSNYRPILPARLRRILRQLHIKQPYILALGTLQPRKNLVRLVEAFESLHHQLTTRNGARRSARSKIVHPQLVLAGKVGWLVEPILKRISASPLHQLITITGYVSETTKQALLQGASVTALVGLSEGFGIPALEALRAGCVPVIANNTSLPEVTGRAGIAVDPFESSSITEGLYKALVRPPSTQKRWLLQARRQLRLFTWERSARAVLSCLTTAALHPTA